MSTERPDAERAPRAERFFLALLARRRLALAAIAIVLGVAGVFAARVRPDYDANGFLPSWDARRVVYEEHAAAFPRGDRLVSVFVAAPAGLDAATYERLSAVARALEDEGLDDVRWLGNLEVAEADPDDPLALRVSTPFVARGAEHLGTTFARYRDDPLFVGRVWNATGTVFSVHAALPAERDQPEGQLALETSLDARLAPLRAAGAEVRVAGLPILKARGFRLVQSDSARFLGLGLLLVVLLLGVVLRRPREVLAILGALLPAYIITLGVMGATGTPISALTSFIPLLVLVVGVCDALHLIGHCREHRAHGAPRRVAIARAFSELLPSCFYTSLTTAVGFLSLLATGVAIIVEFAAFTALSVALTFASAMVLLPLLLDAGREAAPPKEGPIERALDRALSVARAHAQRPRAFVLGAFALVTLGSLMLASGLRTNGTMIDDVDPTHPLMRDLAWLEGEGFGLHALDLWIRVDGHSDEDSGAHSGVQSDDESPLLEPATLAWMDRTSRWLELHTPVRSVVGPGDYLAQTKRALGLAEDANPAEDPDGSGAATRGTAQPTSFGTAQPASLGTAPSGFAPSGSAPSGSAPSGSAPSGSAPSGSAPSGSAQPESLRTVQSRQEAAQLFLLLEMARPAQLDEVWRPAEGQAQLSASALDLGSAEMAPFFESLESHLERDPPPTGVRVDVTGTLRLAHVTLAEVVGGFGTSLAIATLAIFLLMSWMFRSFAQGLVALIPNVLPLLVLLGVMGLLGLDVKPSSLLVFSVAFGIAADDTLHLLGRFRELVARGWRPDAAVDEALRTSGRAILLTSVVLGVGFSVLLASEFRFLALVGGMTAISVVVAALADLFVYPALLRFTARRVLARPLVEAQP